MNDRDPADSVVRREVPPPTETPPGESGLSDGSGGTSEQTRAEEGSSTSEKVSFSSRAADALDLEVELVFGVTRAVGTPSDASMEQLRNSLSNYGYDVSTVKISDLLMDSLQAGENWPDGPDEHERVTLLIDEGNRLNREAKREDELAVRAITEIRGRRSESRESLKSSQSDPSELVVTPTEGHGGESQSVDPKLGQDQVEETKEQSAQPARSDRRRAYIIDSLKRPKEVTLLREVYGDHFILFGLQASAPVREDVLVSKLVTDGVRNEDAKKRAKELIDRDNHEQVDREVGPDGKTLNYGQDMLVTFPMADVFINAEATDEASRQVRRAVQLLFGDPEASGPDLGELGLHLASQAAARSTELGLRVGAVIINDAGDVLAIGTNRHPIEDASPEFDAGALDIRQLVRATIAGLVGGEVLEGTKKAEFETDPDKFVRGLLQDVLADSDLKGLTEYQRAVHAEMDALISAARQRVELAGATVYVTNYPCHGCAKHLIALGLKVVYLEPYAKGKAQSMYGDATLSFVPFTGVAPRRYEAWFVTGRAADRKDKSGRRIHWGSEKKVEATPNVTTQISMESKHWREKFAIGG